MARMARSYKVRDMVTDEVLGFVRSVVGDDGMSIRWAAFGGQDRRMVGRAFVSRADAELAVRTATS